MSPLRRQSEDPDITPDEQLAAEQYQDDADVLHGDALAGQLDRRTDANPGISLRRLAFVLLLLLCGDLLLSHHSYRHRSQPSSVSLTDPALEPDQRTIVRPIYLHKQIIDFTRRRALLPIHALGYDTIGYLSNGSLAIFPPRFPTLRRTLFNIIHEQVWLLVYHLRWGPHFVNHFYGVHGMEEFNMRLGCDPFHDFASQSHWAPMVHFERIANFAQLHSDVVHRFFKSILFELDEPHRALTEFENTFRMLYMPQYPWFQHDDVFFLPRRTPVSGPSFKPGDMVMWDEDRLSPLIEGTDRFTFPDSPDAHDIVLDFHEQPPRNLSLSVKTTLNVYLWWVIQWYGFLDKTQECDFFLKCKAGLPDPVPPPALRLHPACWAYRSKNLDRDVRIDILQEQFEEWAKEAYDRDIAPQKDMDRHMAVPWNDTSVFLWPFDQRRREPEWVLLARHIVGLDVMASRLVNIGRRMFPVFDTFRKAKLRERPSKFWQRLMWTFYEPEDRWHQDEPGAERLAQFIEKHLLQQVRLALSTVLELSDICDERGKLEETIRHLRNPANWVQDVEDAKGKRRVHLKMLHYADVYTWMGLEIPELAEWWVFVSKTLELLDEIEAQRDGHFGKWLSERGGGWLKTSGGRGHDKQWSLFNTYLDEFPLV